MKRIIFLALSLSLFAINSLAAQGEAPDFMRSMGKMYVVVAVIIAVFLGIVIFLTYLDKRVTKLENQIISNDQKQ